MWKAFRRWWKYQIARLSGNFEERADPKVQLEQAITEAHDQHKRLTQQAANVIANQKQTEMRLNRVMEDLEKVSANARQAVMMADQAAKEGDEAKATEYTQAAESFANRMITLESEVDDLKALHFQAAEAADQAKSAVQQNSAALQKKLSERQALLGKIDQANMQDEMNTAMAQLSATVGEDVPTLEEVRSKVETRYAKAKGMSELQGSSVEGRMLEVEQAAMNVEAQGRLSEIKAQLGIAPSTDTSAGEDQTAISGESAGDEAPDMPGEGQTQQPRDGGGTN
ncbi:MAG: PspA/IM30 family protein [Acidimicrobiales bacterium]|nr:PspA/IM30 family protein [Acidimicrobiales bacterium]